MPDAHPAWRDVRGCVRLLLKVEAALERGDRDLALELLNRERELARHAFELVKTTQMYDGDDG